MNVRLRALAGAAVLLALGACDSAPGPVSLDEQPPTLSAFSYAPRGVTLEALPDGATLDGDVVRVPLRLSVEVTDPNGDLGEVTYVVQAPLPDPDGTRPAVATGTLQRTEGRRYEASVDLALPAAEVGGYPILIFATDGSGLPSNQVRGLLTLSAEGRPPVIENVDVAAEVPRPAEGEPAVPVLITATVSDPDGLGNIRAVNVRVNGGVTFQLCDDGGDGPNCNANVTVPSGDAAAGDGVYTITFVIENTNALGVNTLEFQAFDRSGLESEVVTRTLTVVE